MAKQHTEKSLMNKTKKELVEIILRKDDIENALRKDCEGMDKTIKTLKKTVDDANNNVLKHQEAMDDLTSQKVELQMTVNKLKNQMKFNANLNWIIGSMFVIAIIIAYII